MALFGADGCRGRGWKGFAIAGAVIAISAVGCSNVVNEGGDTTCKSFLTQDDGRQNDEVSKMLKDQGKNDPSGLQLSAARTAALTYCETLGNENSKISEAPHL